LSIVVKDFNSVSGERIELFVLNTIFKKKKNPLSVYANAPPDTSIDAPVIYELALLAKKAAASANS